MAGHSASKTRVSAPMSRAYVPAIYVLLVTPENVRSRCDDHRLVLLGPCDALRATTLGPRPARWIMTRTTLSERRYVRPWKIRTGATRHGGLPRQMQDP